MAKRQEIPDIFAQERQKMTVLDDVLSGKPVVQVAISSIRIDGGTQMRAQLDDATVFEYTQTMAAADGWGTFPPVVAYYDGTDYWLGDGFHRVAAFRDAFTETTRKIPVDVRAGTRRDAILHAAGANANHGLRRTNADKRRAVETLLRDEEWAGWSNYEIARRCNVSEYMVRDLRSHYDKNVVTPTERTYTTKHGTTATMHTANIGSTQPQRTNTYESAVPTINVVPSEATGSRPAPTSIDGRQYRTVTELIEEIKTCVKPHYAGTGLTRSQIAADIRRNCNSREGAFWEFVSRQTSNFRPIDLDLAMGQVAYQVETYGVDFNLNAHADLTLGGAPAGDWMHQRPAALVTPAGSDTTDDDEEEQPLQLATVDDDEVANILTPDRPKSSMAVHFSSETPEHYTPNVIIEAAIACMGGIDLDPCSNSKTAPNVPAAAHYTREDDGLAQEWRGCVYMNPPYGREIDDWVAKLVSEYEAGNVTEAIALVPSRTDTQWWQRLREYHVCLVSGRLKFIGNNDPAPFPSAVFYLGQNIGRFVYAFEDLGDIWRRTVRGVDYGD